MRERFGMKVELSAQVADMLLQPATDCTCP